MSESLNVAGDEADAALSPNRASRDARLWETIAYAAPAAGGYFFYIPMWSILPGIYGKYFGLSLTSIAAVVLFIRVFDGVVDMTIGYISDLHRAAGGSRRTWVAIGGLGSVLTCHFLFQPPHPATSGYYLGWSLAYFLAFTVAEIPHLTWGSELTLDYQQRAKVYGVRNVLARFGLVMFYALPLLTGHPSEDYTPQVMQYAIYIGGVMTVVGLVWALIAAPPGRMVKMKQQASAPTFVQSLVRNKPLLLYFAAFACVGLSSGMWNGLLYFYLDSYLDLGDRVATMFLVATIVAMVSTPVWIKLIQKTSKAATWAIGLCCFLIQLVGMLFFAKGTYWGVALMLVTTANLSFCCHDVAAISTFGDIVDYGKLKFRTDLAATYFALITLVFKVGLGVGGGLALAVAGAMGFSPSATSHSALSILGLKLGFIAMPACFALIGMAFIVRTPIDKRRHGIIQRRIERRAVMSDTSGPEDLDNYRNSYVTGKPRCS